MNDEIKSMFHFPPKPPNSTQLVFEEEDSAAEIKDVFFILIELFEIGMKLLYGNDKGNVNLAELSDLQFKRIDDYFNSIGFRVFYKINNASDGGDYNGNCDGKNENIFKQEKDRLEDYYLTLESCEKKYILNFGYYI